MTYAKQIQNFSPVHAPCGPLVASESRDLIRGERAGGTDNMGCELDHIAQQTAFCLKQQVQQEPEAPGAMLDFPLSFHLLQLSVTTQSVGPWMSSSSFMLHSALCT